MNAPLLAIEGVHSGYGRVEALRGVSLFVNEGEIVTLIGANGAGKSTLLMTICGEPRTLAGSIAFAGRDLARLKTHQIMRLGIAHAPEGRRIFPRMTVLENLRMGAIVTDPTHFERDLDRVLGLFPILAERTRQRGGTLQRRHPDTLAL